MIFGFGDFELCTSISLTLITDNTHFWGTFYTMGTQLVKSKTVKRPYFFPSLKVVFVRLNKSNSSTEIKIFN